MTYTDHDIQKLDLEQFVRLNITRFLGDRPLTGQTILALLGSDIQLIHPATITSTFVDDWYILLSSHRWLPFHNNDSPNYFKQLQPFPEAGVNSVRFDSVLFHFVRQFTLLSPAMHRTLKGTEPPVSVLNWCSDADIRWVQGIAFRM